MALGKPSGTPRTNRVDASQNQERQKALDDFLVQLETVELGTLKEEIKALESECSMPQKLGLPIDVDKKIFQSYATVFTEAMNNLKEGGEEVAMEIVEGETIIHVDDTTSKELIEQKIQPLLGWYEITKREDGLLTLTSQEGGQIYISIDKKQSVSNGPISSVDDFNAIDKTKEAQQFLDSPLIPQPTEVFLSGDFSFVLSNPYMSEGRKYCMMYVQVDGIIEPRLLYFSNSGQNRHSCPGVKFGGRYSKGTIIMEYSYEKSTAVIGEMNTFIENQPLLEDAYGYANPIEFSEEVYGLAEMHGERNTKHTLYNKMKEEVTVDPIFLEQNPGLEKNFTHDQQTFGLLKDDLSTDEVTDIYKNLQVPGTLGSLEKTSDWTAVGTHGTMGYIYESTIQGTLGGENITISIRKGSDKDGLLWIENITFTDAPVSSFGVKSKQLNGGLLLAKPYEYKSQVPLSVLEDGYDNNEVHDGTYIDIRKYINANPFVRQLHTIASESIIEERPGSEIVTDDVLLEELDKETSPYGLGKKVNVPRSDGSISSGKVWSYGRIKVSYFNDNNTVITTYIRGDINDITIGQSTRFTDIEGNEHFCTIDGVSAQEKYTVHFQTEQGNAYKHLSKESLDSVN